MRGFLSLLFQRSLRSGVSGGRAGGLLRSQHPLGGRDGGTWDPGLLGGRGAVCLRPQREWLGLEHCKGMFGMGNGYQTWNLYQVVPVPFQEPSSVFRLCVFVVCKLLQHLCKFWPFLDGGGVAFFLP